VYSSAPHTAGNQIALTIDDGYCGECIAKYVAFAQSTGMHITFNPNGVFGRLWTPLVDIVKPLVTDRQVQFGNHTWDHANLLTRSNAQIADELLRNEDWIQTTFGVSSRPWFRPPYGYYDARVEEVAANQGFTNILMWNGTLGDATAISPQQLLGLAQRYLTAGRIVLGHMNHPTVLALFPQLQAMIAERGLQPVTLDEMFGTSRTTG
jgi:peptidoglycan/xylan/chitin deacetylase (PgdA/CDA1 family)